MFTFDTTDRHFSNLHLDDPFAPVALASKLGAGRVKKGDGVQHMQLEIDDAMEAEGGESNHSSPRLPPKSMHTPEPVEPTLSRHGTPPIDIVKSSVCRSQSRARCEYEEHTLVEATPRPLPKPARKKKRGPKKGAVAALTTVRGFTPATSGDDDSDFDLSSQGFRKRRDLSVQRTSSVVRKDLSLDRSGRPSIGKAFELRSSSPSSGISALTRQLDALQRNGSPGKVSLVQTRMMLSSETTSTASVTSGTSGDEDTPETTSYEVPLEQDFISSDISQKDKCNARSDALSSGEVVRKMHATDFDPLRCLGKGTYGTVLLVKQTCTGKLYAQKQFRKASLTVHKQLVEQTKTERSILESINCHPFVVKLYYAFQDHEKLYLILEYAQGGELFEHLRTERMFPEDTAAFYMAEMVLALEHLHHTVSTYKNSFKYKQLIFRTGRRGLPRLETREHPSRFRGAPAVDRLRT